MEFYQSPYKLQNGTWVILDDFFYKYCQKLAAQLH